MRKIDDSMDQHQKVVFRLEQDEDGYPPVSSEGLWACPLTGGNFRIDNIPFYVHGISGDDEIEADLIDGEYWFRSLTKPSANSTFRLLLMDPKTKDRIRTELRSLGCKSEFNQHIGLVAVEIPGEVPIQPFLDYILEAQENGTLDFEEAALRHALPTI